MILEREFDQFITLCNCVREKEKITYGVNEIENELLNVLNFVKISKKERKRMEEFFIKIVKGIELYPLEIIIFCMRELQWKEIKIAALSEKTKTNDWRVISAMNNILAVYEKEWEDGEMYKYYSKENK